MLTVILIFMSFKLGFFIILQLYWIVYSLMPTISNRYLKLMYLRVHDYSSLLLYVCTTVWYKFHTNSIKLNYNGVCPMPCTQTTNIVLPWFVHATGRWGILPSYFCWQSRQSQRTTRSSFSFAIHQANACAAGPRYSVLHYETLWFVSHIMCRRALNVY